MARFLIDESLPRSTADALRTEGFDATHIRDVGLGGQNDASIFAYAQAADAVLVTADKGFGSILSYPPGTHAGVIVSRLPGSMPMAERNQRVVSAIRALASRPLSGLLVVIGLHRVRVRRTGIDTC